MTQKPKTQITRYEVVTVDDTGGIPNDYGDLNFTDIEGNSHKIGNKRQGLFDAIVAGQSVKLGYAKYMNREYIATVEPYTGKPAQASAQAAPKPPVVANKPLLGEGQARGMVVKELGDMMRAKLLTPIFGDKIAHTLTAWYRTEILGITKVAYDGKDLPKME